MHAFEKVEEIRQWLVDTVTADLHACGIAEEMADLELHTLANGVAFYLAQLTQAQWPAGQGRLIRRLDLFQLLADINLSPEYGTGRGRPAPGGPLAARPLAPPA